MAREDGPRAAGASGRGGHLRGRGASPVDLDRCRGGRDLWGRRAIAGLLRTAAGSQACSLSVDVVQRQRHAAILFFANGGRRRRRWRARMDLAPPGRAVAAATCGVAARAPLTLIAAGAAATYGVAARSPGCCAQRLGRARKPGPVTAFFIPTRAQARRRRCWPSCEVGGRRQPPPVLQPLGPVSGVSSLWIFRCSIPLVSGRRAARRISFLPNRLADGGGRGPGGATGRAAGSGVCASPPGGAQPH